MKACYAIIAAAGSGQRMALPYNKVLYELGGKTLLERVCERFEAEPAIDGFIVMANQEDLEQLRGTLRYTKLLHVLYGGATRQETVRLGLQALLQDLGPFEQAEAPYVLVHDAARALLSQGLLRRLIEALQGGHLAVAPALPMVDSIRQLQDAASGSKALERGLLRAVQTPQGADLLVLYQALEAARLAGLVVTDELSALEWIGYPISLLPGERANFKVTTPDDLPLAEFYLSLQAEGF